MSAVGDQAMLQSDPSGTVSVTQISPGTERSSGIVAVEISTNSREYTESGMVFEYLPEVRVTRVVPSHGPLDGGTMVHVYGENFRNTSVLYCRFGEDMNAEVPAALYVNETLIVCMSPPALYEHSARVEVSLNGPGRQSNFSVGGAWFTWDARVEVHSFYPNRAPSAGNHSVRITGRNFKNTYELKCKFGKIIVDAIWLNDGELVCYTPALSPGTYVLEITANDQQYSAYRKTFYVYSMEEMERVSPVSGPACSAGSRVKVYGHGFLNTSLLSCRFGPVIVPARFVSSHELHCDTPPLFTCPTGTDMAWMPLTDHRNRLVNPRTGSKMLFPTAHYYPLYRSKLVAVDTSNNAQDFTDSGIRFLYQLDASVIAVSPTQGWDTGANALFVRGSNFVNTTSLRCRIGQTVTKATFLTTEMVLCTAPLKAAKSLGHGQERHASLATTNKPHADPVTTFAPGMPQNVFVEVSNNAEDFTSDRRVFQYKGPCPTGNFCPKYDQSVKVACPRGAFCPGEGNANFTLCPRGTYQPNVGASTCLRCPIGYMCPDFGMHVPRICPAGYVCDVTGTEVAEQPCPEGHFCLEGTATTADTCGHPSMSSELFPSLTHAEMWSTKRLGRRARGFDLVLGARNAGCWNNATDDFGLQQSPYPARFWMEKHMLPLSSGSEFFPIRGRYCLDDRCLRLGDANDVTVADYAFDYSSRRYSLRRPVPCPAGTYCFAGTAGGSVEMKNYSNPQPCMESYYCPEGSSTPTGQGECKSGFYCPLSGVRKPCPAGTMCPKTGHTFPLPCQPGYFNGQVAQANCTECPPGYICPTYGLKGPTGCPLGHVCSRFGLVAPNIRCPPGYYCPSGTMTSDPFRNDTTLRPYPCNPGTYCLGGVGYDTVKKEDFLHAQNCTEGFFCELASTTPMGSGLCPRGFTCPQGTAIPIPTPKGKFARLEGTVEAASCLPGFYAPTVETVKCYPCPAGTQCENDGTSIATVCPPGTFREFDSGFLTSGGTIMGQLICQGCPQGKWSKQWEVRGKSECTMCPPGIVCPIDGMSNPCSVNDLPTTYIPTASGYSEFQCGTLGSDYHFGILTGTEIDTMGRGPRFRTMSEAFSWEREMVPVDPQNPDGPKIQRCSQNPRPAPTADGNGDCARFEKCTQDPRFCGMVVDGNGNPVDTPPKFICCPQCFFNPQPRGSVLFQRFSDYHGPRYNITNDGREHQGYGTDQYEGYFGRGSLFIDLSVSRVFSAKRNCTPGYYRYHKLPGTDKNLQMEDPTKPREWIPGTCEADVFCNSAQAAQAQPCSEGYICEEGTTATTATYESCAPGYVCNFGATPDVSVEAPQNRFQELCPEGYICAKGTGSGQKLRVQCPLGYFCPTGTSEAILGRLADDSLKRNLTAEEANPYINVLEVKKLPGLLQAQNISLHDQRCFNGSDPKLLSCANYDDCHEARYDETGNYLGMINLAVKGNLKCARDHKWRLMKDVETRAECDPLAQSKIVLDVWRLWKCTQAFTQSPPWPQRGIDLVQWPPWMVHTNGLGGGPKVNATANCDGDCVGGQCPELGKYDGLSAIRVRGFYCYKGECSQKEDERRDVRNWPLLSLSRSSSVPLTQHSTNNISHLPSICLWVPTTDHQQCTTLRPTNRAHQLARRHDGAVCVHGPEIERSVHEYQRRRPLNGGSGRHSIWARKRQVGLQPLQVRKLTPRRGQSPGRGLQELRCFEGRGEPGLYPAAL